MTESRLFSTRPGGPDGFVFREALAPRDVRVGPFAVWAPDVEEACRLLPPSAENLVGLVVTPGRSVGLESLPSGLHHLEVAADSVALREMVDLLLILLETLEARRQEILRRSLELERSHQDLQRLISQQAEFRDSLLREVAERRAAEEAARHSQARLETIYDSVSDAITIHDPWTGAVLEGNRSACEMLGREQVGGLALKDMVADPHALADLRAVRDVARVVEWRLRRSGGPDLWVESSLRHTVIAGREVVLVTSRDITERKAAEEERRVLERQIQHSQRLESLGVLAGGVAHDFNNLLMAIQGNVDLALLDLDPESPVRSPLREVLRASLSASDLCRQILAYSGRGRYDLEPLDLNALVADLGRMFGASISRKVTLHWNLQTDLPAALGDATQIRQIAMNLILNAVEAFGEGAGDIRISTSLVHCTRRDLNAALLGEVCEPGEYLALDVDDTGCGMDAGTLGRIFEPFFTTKVLGRGLGLAAVLGIVRGHHGALKVESQPGRGTSFRVLLPAQTEALAVRKDPPSGEVSGEWQGSGTILVVDDEELLRVLLRQTLERHGFQVIVAEEGQEAVRLFQVSPRIDLVLLDLRMPRMNGVETAGLIRAMDPAIPIVMMSGNQDIDLANGSAGPRLQGFLQKPFRTRELRELLQRLLGGRVPEPQKP